MTFAPESNMQYLSSSDVGALDAPALMPETRFNRFKLSCLFNTSSSSWRPCGGISHSSHHSHRWSCLFIYCLKGWNRAKALSSKISPRGPSGSFATFNANQCFWLFFGICDVEKCVSENSGNTPTIIFLDVSESALHFLQRSMATCYGDSFSEKFTVEEIMSRLFSMCWEFLDLSKAKKIKTLE